MTQHSLCSCVDHDILQTPFFDYVAGYLFHMAISLTEIVLMLAFLGTPDMITLLFFFGVLAD